MALLCEHLRCANNRVVTPVDFPFHSEAIYLVSKVENVRIGDIPSHVRMMSVTNDRTIQIHEHKTRDVYCKACSVVVGMIVDQVCHAIEVSLKDRYILYKSMVMETSEAWAEPKLLRMEEMASTDSYSTAVSDNSLDSTQVSDSPSRNSDES
uniref:Protein yippee-like n=1 Tax=Acrobeloides nanus TaxID=290746 RepID=A0A914E2Q5_9BILA